MGSFDPIYLLFFPVFLFSLSLHECAHAWAAKRGGDLTAAYSGRLTLNPMAHIDPIGTLLLPALMLFTKIPLIGWAKPVPVNDLRFRRSDWIVWVSLAGPLSNLLLVGLSALILKAVLLLGGGVFEVQFWGAVGRLYNIEGLPAIQIGALGLAFVFGIMFIQLNLVLAIFNMLPIPPLDGSKLLYYYFIRRNPNMLSIWVGLHQYGFLLLYFLILFPPLRSALGMAYSTPFKYILFWLGS